MAYRDKLAEALKTGRLNPAIGHKCPVLPDTHRLFLVGSHVIVYRLQEQLIGVMRILHQRMSLPRYVSSVE